MDGHSNDPPRKLSETKQFEQEKNALLGKGECKRLDEIMAGLDVALCQNPERYPTAVEGTNLRTFSTIKFETIPSFRIWYTFDDETVNLLHIEVNGEEV